jgi:hypothetical protein
MNQQRGGANRGQGRKPLKPGETTTTISMRLTEEQKRKFYTLGGPKWVRSIIDSSQPPEK